MAVYVGPDHDTSMVNSEVVVMKELTTPIEVEVPEGYIPSPEVSDETTLRLSRSDYENWEKETLEYSPDYYTIENDYDDEMDTI